MSSNQNNTYSQQNTTSSVVPLPNDFLESEENGVNTDQEIQQRIINGECVPEPAEYCNVSNEIYNTYDTYQQPPQFNHYQHLQHAGAYGQQYAQIEDPWVYPQNDPTSYAQEGFDPTLNDQYIYSDQATSSNNLTDNPFEEEDPYEPMPVVRIQPMRLIGKPPVRPVDSETRPTLTYATRQSTRSPSYHPSKIVIRRPPRKQEIRRDSFDDDYFVEKNSTEKARSQAAQRIATPEGWNCLNQWFKKAQEADDRDKLLNLLESCKEADIPASLLRENDTAKIVKEIARKHPNAAINRLSNDVLAKWKKTVIEASKKPKVAPKTILKTEKPTESPKETVKEDQPASSYSTDEFLLDKLTEQMDKNILRKKEETPVVEAAKRPRTKAKVKLSNSRRTGLEGDDDSTTTVKKTEVPKKKSIQSPVLENVTAPKTTTPPQKRVLQQSDTFMAAFDDFEKKVPIKKKMKVNKIVKVVQPDVPEKKSSPTIKSEWDIKPEAFGKQSEKFQRLEEIPIIPRERGAGILRRTSMTPDEKSLRKIRFNDQFEKPLVEVRYFDIEEGERINVHRAGIYAHDQIKRWEMEEEGKQMKLQKSGDSEENEQEDSSPFISSSSVKLDGSNNAKKQMPPLPLSSGSPTDFITPSINSSPWNLLLLESFSSFVRGENSKLREIEARRELSSMAAFVDPNTPTNAIGEDDPELLAATDLSSRSMPIRIPTVLQTNDEKPNKDQLDLGEEEGRTTRGNTLQLPLPFSAQISAPLTTISDASPLSPTFQNDVPTKLPHSEIPKADTQQKQILDEYDSLMEMLKKQQSAASNSDQDLRPIQDEPMEMDQDLRVPNDDETMDYMETPLSPPTEQTNSSQPQKPGLTLDALSVLATLAGRDSGSVTAGLNLAGGLNLAEILSKVESAQSGSVNEPVINQNHQYAQEDSTNVPPPVITQIHGEFNQQFFRHPDRYNPSHQYHPRPGAQFPLPTSRFQAPGIRPMTTNPRGGFFHTATNPTRYRTVPCKYFLAGTCNFGDACRFLHTNPDGEVIPHNPPQPTFQPPSQQPTFQPPQIKEEEQGDDAEPSFQLALAPKTSSQSIETAANYAQRGNSNQGRRGGTFGGYRRYEDDRTRSRRSPRRYDDDRHRHSPTRSSRRRRSRSKSADSRDESHESRRRSSRRRSNSLSSTEGSSRKRSSERRERSPPNEPKDSRDSRDSRDSKEKSREKSPEKTRNRSRSTSPKSDRRSSRQESP